MVSTAMSGYMYAAYLSITESNSALAQAMEIAMDFLRKAGFRKVGQSRKLGGGIERRLNDLLR